MTRSPLAYPLTRGVDGEAGGAADLQTDTMRFMAILSLCLVAIFALVQSIPMVPEPAASEAVAGEPLAAVRPQPAPKTAVDADTPQQAQTADVPETVALTRPRWQPKFKPAEAVATPTESTPAPITDTEIAAPLAGPQGFTLRFESDLALTRLVASSQVGVYAITPDRAQRMTVSNSRISFWDASAPNLFHEMESATVPAPVTDALARSGVNTEDVSWGVTLPSKLSGQLDTLMREHSGGALVIAGDGELRLEAL